MRQIHITIDDSRDGSRAIISSDIDKPVSIRAPNLAAAAKMVADLNKTADEVAEVKIDKPKFQKWVVKRYGKPIDDMSNVINDSDLLCTVPNDLADLIVAAPDMMRYGIKVVDTFFADPTFHGNKIQKAMEDLRDAILATPFGEDLE